MAVSEGKSCGSCTLCCKLMSVVEINKPPQAWCVHADRAVGCRIYETRPASCRHFDCLWLTEADLGPELRPDRVKTVMVGFRDQQGAKVIAAVCDRATPTAWMARPMIDLLRVAAAHGHPVFAMAGRRAWQVFPDREVETATLPVPAEGSGLLSFDSVG